MTTVLAHGTFDIIHPGHIGYLEFARSHGDHLIVALSSDYITAKHKGTRRPILPFEERKKVIQSLRFVDEVVETPYPTDDHRRNLIELVRTLRPNIFVSSYNNYHEQYGDELAAAGVTLIQAPQRFGTISTTQIVERIVKRYGKA